MRHLYFFFRFLRYVYTLTVFFFQNIIDTYITQAKLYTEYGDALKSIRQSLNELSVHTMHVLILSTTPVRSLNTDAYIYVCLAH